MEETNYDTFVFSGLLVVVVVVATAGLCQESSKHGPQWPGPQPQCLVPFVKNPHAFFCTGP